MKNYEAPEMNILLLTAEDVIATSRDQIIIEGTAPDSDDTEFGG